MYLLANSPNRSMPDPKNPLYPVIIDDYAKLFDQVLSADALLYFQTLKRKHVLGREMLLDKYNKL